jgi:hypothetical protein
LLSDEIFDGGQKESILALQTYLGNNRERLCYAERLRKGQAIEADGSVLAVAASGEDDGVVCRSLLRPMETLPE